MIIDIYLTFTKSIIQFLKKETVKRLINVKFTAISKSDVDKYAALIVYEEENSNTVKEDPQIYK